LGQAIFGPHFACRFTPTCSQYTKEAISRYGIIHGMVIGVKRFARCQPFSTGGLDPVPDKI
jgi:putative membrane protein insertion efficiency factor